MTAKRIAQLYEQHKLQIFKLCHTMAAKSGYEFHDLLSAAHSAFMEAAGSFDALKGAFSTHVTIRVHNKLVSHMRKFQQVPRVVDGWESWIRDRRCDGLELFSLNELCEGLSDDACELVALTLSERPKWARGVTSTAPRMLRAALRREMTRRGWSSTRWQAAAAEIKTMLDPRYYRNRNAAYTGVSQ